MIVIDASSLAKYVLHEDNWRDVGSFIKMKRPLYSIDHIVKEVGNSIWKHCYLRKVISREEALKLYRALMRLFQTKAIIIESEEKYLNTAMQIGLDYGATLYDSLYLAQAQEYSELLTSDERQAKIAVQLNIRVHFVT